jgi:hypothetical protein
VLFELLALTAPADELLVAVVAGFALSAAVIVAAHTGLPYSEGRLQSQAITRLAPRIKAIAIPVFIYVKPPILVKNATTVSNDSRG